MRIKLLQLNIEAGSRYSDLIKYLKQEQFDLLHFQEVCGGKFSRIGNDNFSALKDELTLHGDLAISMNQIHDKSSYFANATFYKPNLIPLKKQIVWLHPFREVEEIERTDHDLLRSLPRNALALQFQINNELIWFINTHLAWGPNPKDEPHKIIQGQKLESFIANLTDPFILSGDFNVDKDSSVVKSIEKLGVNHAVNAGITNTLNPNVHRAKELFPKGVAVDFIFTSPDLIYENFSLVDKPDISDHLGLKIDIIV